MFLCFLDGGTYESLCKHGSNRRKSPSPQRNARMISVNQEVELDLSKVAVMLFKEKKFSIFWIALLPLGSRVLGIHLSSEPQTCITELLPCHKGVLRVGEGQEEE